MAKLSPETFEGRLIAQRQMLAEILALLAQAGGPATEAAEALLEDRFVPPDQQEDPGAVPTEAFAIEGAIEDERRLIVEEARRRVAAREG